MRLSDKRKIPIALRNIEYFSLYLNVTSMTNRFFRKRRFNLSQATFREMVEQPFLYSYRKITIVHSSCSP